MVDGFSSTYNFFHDNTFFLSKERTCAKTFLQAKTFTKLLRKVLSKTLRGKYTFL